MKKNAIILGILFLFAHSLSAQYKSWIKTKEDKTGHLKVYYYPQKPFIYKDGTNLKGMEAEMLNEFKFFLSGKHDIKLELDFEAVDDLAELQKKISNAKDGEVAISGLPLKDNSKDIVFSKAYLDDMHLLVCSANLPNATNIAGFRQSFKDAKAVVVKGSMFESEVLGLKKYLPDMKIEYVEDEDDVYNKLQKDNYFSFVSLVNYIYLQKNGIYLRRQKLFSKNKMGLAVAFPKSSDWTGIFNQFIKDEDYKVNVANIAASYLGEEIHEFMLLLKGKDVVSKEIELLVKEREIQQEELAKQGEELSMQTIYKNVFIAGFVIILLFVGLLYSRYRYKQRVNRLLEDKNKYIQNQKDELEAKTKKLDELNETLHVQNQKVTSSINAAKSIQNAILPLDYRFSDVVKEHFVIFQPKDIVSGDFYWMTQAEHRTFLAVVDCTGHGVPGAFMSMLGYAFLNEIVNIQGVYAPETILELLHIAIKKALKQDHLEEQSGMDICLIRIDKKWNDEYEVTFAGAKRPLYIVQNGKINKIKGDRASIGGWQHSNGYNQFKNYVVSLKAGDLIYLCSDGFADTPNPDREKFGIRRFEQIIEENHQKALAEQKATLENELKQFQQDMEQRDDITVLGVKL